MLGLNPKSVRDAWSWSAVFLLLVGLFFIRKTLLAFIIAIMFAYVLFPLVEWVQLRFRWKSRTLAVAVPFVLIVGSLTVGAILIHPRVKNEKQQLAAQLRGRDFHSHLQAWTPFDLPLGQMVADNLGHLLSMVPQQTISTSFRATMRDLGNLAIVPIISFFFLRDGKKICTTVVNTVFCDEPPSAYSRHRQSVEGHG